MSLLQMRAKVRILRAFPSLLRSDSTDNSVFFLRYYAIDQKSSAPLPDGPRFPYVARGDTYVFPLRKPQIENPEYWDLIAEEDFNLLVPSVREATLHEKVRTSLDFLRLELAGAFSRGDYEQIYKAALYLTMYYEPKWEQHRCLYRLIESNVGQDRERWLSIATAYYCSMGVPRQTIAEILEDHGRRMPQLALLAEALDKSGREDLEERLIAQALRRARDHPWGTAVTIGLNYPHHALAVKLLTQSLAANSRDAIVISAFIIKDKEHPLIQAAIAAAVRVLKEHDNLEFNSMRPACELILNYGGENDFAFLLNELRQAQEADHQRYGNIWRSFNGTTNRRLIEVCKILIDDEGTFYPNVRFCDSAAFELQRVTGMNFGMAMGQGNYEREQALAAARAWLRSAGAR